MPKIKMLRTTRGYKEGEMYDLTPNEAFGLVDAGYAEYIKIITKSDYKRKHGNAS